MDGRQVSAEARERGLKQWVGGRCQFLVELDLLLLTRCQSTQRSQPMVEMPLEGRQSSIQQGLSRGVKAILLIEKVDVEILCKAALAPCSCLKTDLSQAHYLSEIFLPESHHQCPCFSRFGSQFIVFPFHSAKCLSLSSDYFSRGMLIVAFSLFAWRWTLASWHAPIHFFSD